MSSSGPHSSKDSLSSSSKAQSFHSALNGGELLLHGNTSTKDKDSSEISENRQITPTNSNQTAQAAINASSTSSSIASGINNDVEKFGPSTFDDDMIGDSIARTESHVGSSFNISRVLTNSVAIEQEILKQEEKGIPIPEMGGDRDYPPQLPNKEAYTVTFNGPNDPLHPHNWPLRKKIVQCAIVGYVTLCVAFGSAIFAASVLPVSKLFHVANVVSTLGISLYVFGFATGPIVWAPLSELYGRKWVILISSFMFTVFNFAVACSDRLESVLICRFFAGCLGAAPLVCVPAAFADLFGNKSRGTAVVIFAMAVFMGPMMAPFIGFFTVQRLSWRWPSFLVGIISSPCLILIPIFFDETHHPIILVNKAREIKRRTGNWGIHAPHEEFTFSLKEIIEKNLTRPLVMLFTEPILLFISIYNAFIYGMLYLFLTAYPIVFAKGYGMAPGVAELPYFGLILGELLGGIFCIYCEKFYIKKLDANAGKIIPEARLPPMIAGAVCFPIGLLWFCWTGNYHDKIHWIVPTISGIFSGFGVMVIFIPSMNYIVDSYLLFAASAMAANAFLRSAFAGIFPLFATFMFDAMHTNWAGLLLGLVSIALISCPLLFVKYGKKLRQKSKYAFDLS